MKQRQAWEEEYTRQHLVSGGTEASQDVKNFARFLRKKQGIDVAGKTVLDLGSGVGKNSLYFALMGARVIGYEFATNALREAQNRASEAGVEVQYALQNIGEPYPLENNSVDIVLDVMSSNSLSDAERTTYLSEVNRVLKPGGLFFIRGLALEGDRHAQRLIQEHPGREAHTYILPGVAITERVFTRDEREALYGALFTLLHHETKQNYARLNGKIYKRSYWILYCQKPPHE